MTKRIFLAALLMLAAAPIRAQTVHDFTAKSSAHIELLPDGEVKTRIENAQFVPYDYWSGGESRPRLATIDTTVVETNHAEGYGPDSKVSVTVDDLSGKAPRRLASWSDPGVIGAVAGDFSVATVPGCCGAPDDHRVHFLETGKLLFSSTGAGATGTTAWAEAPNSKPAIRRWAALDCDVEEKLAKSGVLCRLAYGGDAGELSAVHIAWKPGHGAQEDVWQGLAHDAVLQWVDSKPDSGNAGYLTGDPAGPMDIWAVNNVSDPKDMSGFKVKLLLDKKQMALIPVAADRLELTGAVAAAEIGLAAAPRKE
jgi:hypothetical protein